MAEEALLALLWFTLGGVATIFLFAVCLIVTVIICTIINKRGEKEDESNHFE